MTPRSLRLRLTLWYLLLLAVILGAFSAGVYFALRHSLYANLNDSIEARSEDLLTVVQFTGGRPTLSSTVPSSPGELEQFDRAYDASGSVTFDSSGGAAPVDGEAVQEALSGAALTRSMDVNGSSFHAHFAPISRDGRVLGVIEAARSDGDVVDTLRTLLITLGIAFPATLAVASAGGLFLAGRALAPIEHVTRVARRISAEDLSQRLALDLPDDEVGRLARTFDEMIARLEDSFRRQREFTADASHELRTPLTAIKGQVEVALSKERSSASYQEVMRSVNEEIDRLIRLVRSLLTLARADAGQIPLTREAVSLQSIVSGAIVQVRPLASERGVELSVAPNNDAVVRADADLLLQLILNLLDNAVKHTPAGGVVSVDLRMRDGRVDISVADTGSGIATEHLPRVFDRFYRADKARSREEGGSGLGLSICRWIAEAHGGSISAESAPGRGSTFTVRLPEGR
jgi:heavy metal sensor kinase